MAKLRNMNSVAKQLVDKKFEALLLEGHWPEVQYKKTEFGNSFLMMEYATKRSQYCKAVHEKVVANGFEFGLWQNARNQKYVDAVNDAVNSLTVEEVDKSERFRTMFD